MFEGLPTAGLPPHLDDWADFERFMHTLVHAEAITTIREVWWDVRPHPDFGTVELRICDATPTLGEATALAALAQSLVESFDRRIDAGDVLPVPRDWVMRQNKWLAARYGLDAELIVDERGTRVPTRGARDRARGRARPGGRGAGVHPGARPHQRHPRDGTELRPPTRGRGRGRHAPRRRREPRRRVRDRRPGGPVSTPGLGPFLDDFLATHLEELVAFRRHLHAHPELSGEEHETTALVASRLQVAGLEPTVLATGTGLRCDVGPGTDPSAPLVALRADLDALAMDDENEVPYRSQVPGVAHACGHDVHTTVVLGAGLALARALAEPGGPTGRVRLLFQPAEESAPGGALDVIADGGLADVGAVFGLHCDPRLDRGLLGVRPGAITSAADLVEITLHGPGGHTARPERTVDLVAVAAEIARDLPRRVRAQGDALGLVFGSLHTGHAANVIPTTAVLRGTIRTPDRDAWGRAPVVLADALDELVRPTGARAEIEHDRGVPPVVNDPRMTEVLASAARAVLGAEAVVATEQSAGGDDFAWYLEQVPGSYARLGVHDPDRDGPRLDLHAGTFDVDEGAIAVGIRVLVAAAVGAMAASAGSRAR